MSVLIYYNEIDRFCIEWLGKLMDAGAIPMGVIDNRSIEDVRSEELEPFDQCHFFAGIGVWAYALKQAGWGDRPVWTGSCPCQPFSAAGKRKGIADKRHLWPAFFHLIQNVRPVTIFGEQVASKDGLAWLDLVQTDLEGEGYAVGAVDTCAAGFGAPHIRQRLYWVANTALSGDRTFNGESGTSIRQEVTDRGYGISGGMVQSDEEGLQQGRKAPTSSRHGSTAVATSHAGFVAGTHNPRPQGRGLFGTAKSGDDTYECARSPSTTNKFWQDCEWLPCSDGKTRAIEPGTFPLAHGAANRVGRLRGYGNAIVAPQATEFIKAFMEVNHENHARR